MDLRQRLQQVADKLEADLKRRSANLTGDLAKLQADPDVDQADKKARSAQMQSHLQTTNVSLQRLAESGINGDRCPICRTEGRAGRVRSIGGGKGSSDRFGCDTCDAQWEFGAR